MSRFSFTESSLSFESQADKLLPQNIEAEEAVLGGILLDPEAIYRIWENLKPEHFYISAHADIYQACLTLAKKHQVTNLLTVTSWLADHGLLARVGGRNKLATLADRTPSAINIDGHAELVINKAIRRQLIKFGNESLHLGYATEIELPELMSIVKQESEHITDLLSITTEQDQELLQYNRIVEGVRQIELTIEDPGLKIIKMHNLAKKLGNSMSVSLIETVYYKSLLKDENEPAMSLADFKEKYGQLVNEWHMNAFLPKGKVVLLYAKGGEGKTRIAYDLGLHLLTGQSWSGFPVNDKCKVLYVQTDEAPNDTISVLESRGYEDTMEIHLKSKWTVDHTESLSREIKRLGVQFVLIDSLSTVNKNSLFSENDVEYARPILRLKDIAQELGVTILIIHHANKAGDTRGSSAIFASVSEVWKLERDTAQDAPSDGTGRLLTIEKSRSRAPAIYKLQFCVEDKSWTCLGKQGETGDTTVLKDRIVEFLEKHRGIAYEAEEFTHEIGGNFDSIRRALFQLAEDGVIYKKELIPRKGKPQQYYLPSYNKHINSQTNNSDTLQNADLPRPFSDPTDRSEKCQPFASISDFADHGINQDGSEKYQLFASIPDVGDLHPPQNPQNDFPENLPQNSDPRSPNATSPLNQENYSDLPSEALSDLGGVDQNNCNIPLQTPLEDSDHTFVSLDGQLGTSTAAITVSRRLKRYIEATVDYVFADGSASTQQVHPTDLQEARQLAKLEIQYWESAQLLSSPVSYRVRLLGEDDYIWVENCRLVEIPKPPMTNWYVFQLPSGERVQVRGVEEFQSSDDR